jgi:hypothetical protein
MALRTDAGIPAPEIDAEIAAPAQPQTKSHRFL